MSFCKRALGPASFLALGVCAAGILPLAPAIAAPAAAPALKIKNMAFSQAILKVKVGTTVTWTNGDQVPHNVVARDASFRSKFLTTGDSFSFKFTRKGEFAYYCAIHPQMIGKIIVT
jgi:plastocyanin